MGFIYIAVIWLVVFLSHDILDMIINLSYLGISLIMIRLIIWLHQLRKRKDED